MGYAKHVGRVGASAAALGIGTGMLITPGAAWADDGTTTAVGDTSPGATRTDPVGAKEDSTSVPQSHVGNLDDPAQRKQGTAPGTGTSIGATGGPKVVLNVQTTTTTIDTTAHQPTPTAAPSSVPSVRPPLDPIVVTPTPVAPPPPLAVDPPAALPSKGSETASDSGRPGIPKISIALGNADSTPPNAANGAVPDRFTRHAVLPSDKNGDTGASNPVQGNTFSAGLVASPRPVSAVSAVPAVPTVPAVALADTIAALPGTLISAALNLITQALAPVFGPGAPADNPILWSVLAFVRRQFNQDNANSTPVLAPQQTSQDLDDSQVHGTFGGTDGDGDTLTYTVPATGIGAPTHGDVTIEQSTGTYTYTPDPGYVGEDYFFVYASDDTGAPHIHAVGQTHLAAARVDVTVTAVDAAPVAVGDSYQTAEDSVLTVAGPGVLGNDTDRDSTAVSAVLVTDPAHGTVALNADGSFTYTPTANFNGDDSFTYRASDGVSSSIPATVSIEVTAVYDAPVANDEATRISVVEVATGNVFTNVTNVDGTTLTVVNSGFLSGEYGGLELRDDGSYTYFPGGGIAFGADDFGALPASDPATLPTGRTQPAEGARVDPAFGSTQTTMGLDDIPIDLLEEISKIPADELAAALYANGLGTVTGPWFVPHATDLWGVESIGDNRFIVRPAIDPFFDLPAPVTDTFTYTITDGTIISTAVIAFTVTPLAPIAPDPSDV